jgi:hypothetical protein
MVPTDDVTLSRIIIMFKRLHNYVLQKITRTSFIELLSIVIFVSIGRFHERESMSCVTVWSREVIHGMYCQRH